MKRSAGSFHLWEGELLRIYSSKIYDCIIITSYIQANLPLLFFCFFIAIFLLKSFYPSCRINNFLFARHKGMALRTYLNFYILFR